MDDLMKVAQLAAKEAGTIQRSYYERGIKAQAKSGSYDLVTAADVESEKKIIEIIKDHFPRHGIFAEEAGRLRSSSEYTWIIDPLDGTNNFVFGIPLFCSSIALAQNNTPLIGVVYEPLRDELFYARKDKGAFVNGRSLAVSQARKLDEALLITGFYYDRGPDMSENLQRIREFFLRQIVGVRRLGAAALDLCYVASGRATGFWEFFLNPWDFAAGILLIQEAGGTVTDRHGAPVKLFEKSFIVASNTLIHGQMLDVLAHTQ